MQRDAAALNACCLAGMVATNGHHRRWATVRCVAALTKPGASPASEASAERAARAMLAVADVINKRAASWAPGNVKSA